jgi:hypothetical protein
MATPEELQKELPKETNKEIYQPQDPVVCDVNDKECQARWLAAIADCV